MSRRGEDSDAAKNRRRVLRGYRQEGKRFTPPLLQHMSPHGRAAGLTTDCPSWSGIALLIKAFGLKDGTAVAANVARAAAKCDQTSERAFAATSDYGELTDENKRCLRSALNADGMLDKVRRGLAALIRHYTEFPLAFLAERDEASQDDSGSTLDDLKATIDHISDRESPAAIFAQAGVVYIFFINDRLKVSPSSSLANFPAVEDYPLTDESRIVAASVRSVVTGLLTRTSLPTGGILSGTRGAALAPARCSDGDRLRPGGPTRTSHPHLRRAPSLLKYTVDGLFGHTGMRSATSMRSSVGAGASGYPRLRVGIKPIHLECSFGAPLPEVHGRELHNDCVDSDGAGRARQTIHSLRAGARRTYCWTRRRRTCGRPEMTQTMTQR